MKRAYLCKCGKLHVLGSACPAQQPARPCAACGKPFTPRTRSIDEVTCSPRCAGRHYKNEHPELAHEGKANGAPVDDELVVENLFGGRS